LSTSVVYRNLRSHTDRRIADIMTLQSEITAWAARTNAKQRAVDWQFTIEIARVRLKRLYPKI
jgi:hypothetical protein